MDEPDEFVVKELVMLNENFEDIILFKPPCEKEKLSEKLRERITWSEQHDHGFDWDNGHCPYEHLEKIIKEKCENKKWVFTKGFYKSKFLSKLLGRFVYNPDKVLLLSLRYLPDPPEVNCHLEHTTDNCALSNAHKILNWLHDVQTILL